MLHPQGYSIDLHFDQALENQILKAWNVISHHQISTKLTAMQSRPHITLFSSSTEQPLFDQRKLEHIIKNIASSQQHPLALSFSVVGSFKNVLFLAVTPSLALLKLQSQLCDFLMTECGVEIGNEYKLGSWFPYCAVAEDVPMCRMAEGFILLRELMLPVSGVALDIGLVELSLSCPVKELSSFVLGNSLDTW